MAHYSTWNPNAEEHLIEGFSFMGKSETVNKSHTENIRDTLNETINKTMMSDEAGVKQTVTLSQSMDFDFEACDNAFAPIFLEMVKGANEGKKDCVAAVAPNTDAMASCGKVYKIPEAKDITPCRASNIKQEMVGTFNADLKLRLRVNPKRKPHGGSKQRFSAYAGSVLPNVAFVQHIL